ncbi:hypothetical protein [uncultured Streptococcus sp.]|uniref:hypothetical protein n=1 Tax=uncultured Streptococcus sp. TaxID=83427 RepID=UPI0027DD09B6|nr:hypothetical protein [uncultured Streptococcus sp.]
MSYHFGCLPAENGSTSISKASSSSQSKASQSSTSQSESPTSSTSQSSTETSSQEPSQTELLQSGDYSLLAGNWQNQVESLQIAKDGSIAGDLFIQGVHLDGEIVQLTVQTRSGDTFIFNYVPANIEPPQSCFYPEGGGDISDTSRERIIKSDSLLFGNNNYRDHVYYRAD